MPDRLPALDNLMKIGNKVMRIDKQADYVFRANKTEVLAASLMKLL